MHRSSSRPLWTALLILVVLGLAGCGQISLTPQPTLTPTSEPTATLAPTPTPPPPVPEGPYPPVILDFAPRMGQEVAADAPITLSFDQPMDHDSVERAMRVTPTVEGDFVWPDDATVVFRPKALATVTRYRVALVGEVRSASGIPASPELAFAFSTLAPLQVTRVGPADGAVDVRIDAPVLVAFNRAIVPLTCVGEVAAADTECLPLSLTFTPTVMGTGTWIDTSLYRFDPFRGWAAGKSYGVALDMGARSVEGVVLSAPVAWTFNTALPAIQAVTPAAGQTGVPLETAIRVVFNTPMDQDITGSVFSVTGAHSESVPGVVTWEDNGALLVFTPALTLNLGVKYTVQIGARARAATSAPLANPQVWTFTTVPYPALTASVPENGAAGVGVGESVRLTFAGALDAATLDANIAITPAGKSLYTYFDTAAGVYHLSWDKDPRTEYCVLIKPGIADIYGNMLPESDDLCFVTGDLPPFIGLAMTSDAVTLDAAEPATLYFLVRNLASASFVLSELNEVNFVRGWDAAGASIRDWAEKFDVPRNVATVVPLNLRRLGTALPTGYYQLAWDNPPWGKQSVRIGVVDRHVTLKLAAKEALVWVTDLRSGEPISRTAVRLIDREGLLIAAGTTDAAGLAAIPISPRADLWENVAAVVGEAGKAGFGVAITHWMADAAPWAFDITLDGAAASRFVMNLYTDRPIYRPGQALYFRGVLREDDDRYLLPPLDLPVAVALRDLAGQLVYSTTVALSDMGTFDGEFELSEDAEIGDYVLEATLPGIPNSRVWSVVLSVAAYRKPEFAVAITPEYKDILDGETLRAVVTADYYFGGSVGQAQATWVVRAENALYPAASGLWPWAGTVIAEGQAVTDVDGRFLIEIPAKLRLIADDTPLSPQRWTIEATLTDASGFSASGQAQVMVHPSRFYVQLNPRQWVLRAGTRTEIKLLARDWEQFPVADQALSVILAQRVWQRAPGVEGKWIYTDTKVSSVNVTTNAEGRAVAIVNPPRSGTYVISADAQDADGHSVHSAITLWVSGDETVLWPSEEGKVTPVADARTYRVGDTAKILVPVSFTGPYQMLMTVERNGILEAQRRVLDAPNPVVEIPILDAYVPDIYVSFLVVRSVSEASPTPDVRAGYVKLTVEPTAQTLTVEILPDKALYGPGEEVKLLLRVTDSAGRPVDAELGVALVDKAVLALRDVTMPSSIEALYGGRPLRVMSGDGLLVLFNRVGQRLAALAQDAARLVADYTTAGGIGGGDIGALPQVRAEFPDTAVWEAHVRTSLTGEAQLTFILPDSLTTWVAEARAITADTKVGDGRAELRVTKPLLVRPVTPRFLVVGDQTEVAAVIHNNTNTDIAVTARLAVGEAGTLLSRQQLAVVAGGNVRVAWLVSVAQTSAEALPLLFSVEGGGYQDTAYPTAGGEAGLPLYRYVSPDVVGTAGVLDSAGTRLEAVAIPPEAGAASALTVRVEPSLFSAVVDSLTYMEQYPYASTDVLIGQFSSNVLTYRALQDLEVVDVALTARLETSVRDALEHLYARQNPDGGWGWWEGESTLHLTAYAVLGMTRARQAGFAVREAVFAPALTYISDRLALDLQGETRSADDAFALYVLSEANARWPAGAGAALYAAREALGKMGRAYLLLALGTTDPSDSRIPALLEGLRNDAQITATGAHWESANNLHWNTDTVLTALAVDVLARFAPADPLLTKAVRWLMVARRGDRWQTPYETAWAISGLTAALRVSGDWDSAYNWGVALNGVSLIEGVARARTLDVPVKLRAGLGGGESAAAADVPALLLRDRLNVLEVSRAAGSGQLYYTAHLELALPAESIVAESRGFTLRREYCAVADKSGNDLTPCRPLTTLRAGEMVEVRLTLIAPQTRYFVLLEDPYPAGLEPVDGESSAIIDGGAAGWWNVPFEHHELRDEQAVFVAREMAAGTYRVTYRLRAAVPGTYKALPATVTEMYFPEVWGRTAGQEVIVLPRER